MEAVRIGSGVTGQVTRPVVTMLFVLAIVAILGLAGTGAPFITMYFFRMQDMPAIVLLLATLIFMRNAAVQPVAGARLCGFMSGFERVPVPAMAGLVTIVSLLGTWLVFGRYPLSMDEFWAHTDGTIFASGHLMAQIPAEWREYGPALQPIFARWLPEQGLWASTYLPVNAAIQGLLGPFAGPLLAGFSVLVAADLARRLMPEHPTAPVICGLLMASSSQLLITAMTPYAMTAHLAFNLGWLWLFLHKSRVAQAAALPVAALAIGLHQALFFPLFAVPFLFEAFLSGRRAAAIVHGAAIGAAFLLWSGYDAIVFWWLHAAPAGTGATGTVRMVDRLLQFVSAFGINKIGLMALNLIRWTVWQNFLAVPLLLAVAVPVLRTAGVWRAMLSGILLTLLAITVVMGFQGHGWGYRYLHGLLGNLCLLATFAWFRLLDEADKRQELRAGMALALIVAIALIPVRGWMAARLAGPYREANEEIARMDADLVLVDAPGHYYTIDLVRNDPFLRNRPKRMTPVLLSDAQLVELCTKYRVAVFTDADAARLGIPAGPAEAPRRLPAPCPKVG